MGGEQGELLLGSTRHKRGSLEFIGNCSSGETSVGMYKLKEVMENFVVISWPHTKGSVKVL
jgi:hypothetical protein